MPLSGKQPVSPFPAARGRSTASQTPTRRPTRVRPGRFRPEIDPREALWIPSSYTSAPAFGVMPFCLHTLK
jgi:hypothetical protein